MNDIKKKVGDRIRFLRTGTGLSQEALANRSGLHRSHVGQVERGESNVTVETLWKIGLVLGVPVHELVRVRGLRQLGKKPWPRVTTILKS